MDLITYSKDYRLINKEIEHLMKSGNALVGDLFYSDGNGSFKLKCTTLSVEKYNLESLSLIRVNEDQLKAVKSIKSIELIGECIKDSDGTSYYKFKSDELKVMYENTRGDLSYKHKVGNDEFTSFRPYMMGVFA